jgi:hypothetical protein
VGDNPGLKTDISEMNRKILTREVYHLLVNVAAIMVAKISGMAVPPLDNISGLCSSCPERGEISLGAGRVDNGI